MIGLHLRLTLMRPCITASCKCGTSSTIVTSSGTTVVMVGSYVEIKPNATDKSSLALLDLPDGLFSQLSLPKTEPDRKCGDTAFCHS